MRGMVIESLVAAKWIAACAGVTDIAGRQCLDFWRFVERTEDAVDYRPGDRDRQQRHQPGGPAGRRAEAADVKAQRAEHEGAVALAHGPVVAPRGAHRRAERA